MVVEQRRRSISVVLAVVKERVCQRAAVLPAIDLRVGSWAGEDWRGISADG